MSEELSQIQKVEEVKTKLNELMQLDAIEDFLKTNEFEFDYKEIKYRIKKPTYKHKQEVYKKKDSKIY